MRFPPRWLVMFFLGLFLVLPMAAEAQGALAPEDFTVKGIALGDSEEKMLAAFGKPDFDKERMVWGIHIRYYAFPNGYEVGIAVDTGRVADMLVKSKDYTARAGVRYGATAYKIRTTFGEKERTFLDGSVCYVYENPQDQRQRLILSVDATDGSLCSWRLTSLPLTEEEADALTDEERSEWENTDLHALSMEGRDIDMNALAKDKMPTLRWEGHEREAF
ncbi:hypothetical protein [uncultured Selenomonas sp.]|uniref:hypothetical protein n=1 Tax=uncultured Selenomonas sp. TaxID=159275 RepID=UPI00261B6221|nr:hypothetical protein [uncultured Selenomonas sp.]